VYPYRSSALTSYSKSLIALVGAHGLEPWTR
jgi:hypothetical protein